MKSSNRGKTPRRGEIWWASLDPTIGSEINKTRPVVVVTSSVINERRHSVVVVPLSTSARVAPPLTVRVKCSGSLVVAVIDQVRAVAKERLNELIEALSPEYLRDVEEALRQILELD
jgi:mRNA interferase MazF